MEERNRIDQKRLSNIDPTLRIRVVYQDDDLIVIDKPANLRSVPGHAYPPPNNGAPGDRSPRKRPRPEAARDPESSSTTTSKERRTAQEAWEAAILSFATERKSQQRNSDPVQDCLRRLAASGSLAASVPRKAKLFLRYIQRNQKRIVDASINTREDQTMPQIANQMFEKLQIRQKEFMNLPEPTRHEDSAYGQLMLMMGYSEENDKTRGQQSMHNHQKRLFVVHRLDMETSGIMVFARNESGASKLCKDWRERNDNISKIYMAKVRKWPPFQDSNMTKGRIDISLAPSNERLKWEVVDENNPSGKPSTTLWWILENDATSEGGEVVEAMTLRLQPLTGRTHQLRIHCAHIGSGIIGDSLYGQNRIECLGHRGQRLLLHAYELSFLHPTSNEKCTFQAPPSWKKSV